MFFFLVTATLLAAAQAVPRVEQRFPNGRIVGGENAVIETYPYQISLEKLGRHNCGGSIISANYVVTAGHCVRAGAEALLVRAGSSLQGQGGSVHQVEEAIQHEKFGYNKYGIVENDVAILKLKQPIVFDSTRQPINLFEENEESTPGSAAVVTGWGSTNSGYPDQLQTVTVPIISKELCDKAYERDGGLPAGEICAAYYGVGGKDACVGDSGGPLAINGRLAGIVSWGNGCGRPYYPGVYTEIAAYRDWINKHVQL